MKGGEKMKKIDKKLQENIKVFMTHEKERIEREYGLLVVELAQRFNESLINAMVAKKEALHELQLWEMKNKIVELPHYLFP